MQRASRVLSKSQHAIAVEACQRPQLIRIVLVSLRLC